METTFLKEFQPLIRRGPLLFTWFARKMEVGAPGGKTPEEQEDHLRQLFTILRENHLIINAKRCVFGKSIVSFLGHTVSSASISPLPSHVSAVSSFPHHVHIDIVGPLPPSGGFTHLLTMIDRTTNWPEYCLLSDTCSCALGFVSTWVARFGSPSILTSDRGSQFTLEVWREICNLLGVHQTRTTSYHPESNGFGGTFWPIFEKQSMFCCC